MKVYVNHENISVINIPNSKTKIKLSQPNILKKYKIGQCHKYTEKLINPSNTKHLPNKIKTLFFGNFGLNINNRLTTSTEITFM